MSASVKTNTSVSGNRATARLYARWRLNGASPSRPSSTTCGVKPCAHHQAMTMVRFAPRRRSVPRSRKGITTVTLVSVLILNLLVKVLLLSLYLLCLI